MNIRSHTYVWITFLVFSWKCGNVSGSETSMKTWKQAVLNCYRNNSFLESNITVLQNYMFNHTTVNNSIWVGSFEALLPWIEIRGCYNIPLTCNSLERDEKHAKNLQLCQIKCMKRPYFAFNEKNERCVCFDEHDVVRKETNNASFCQECIDNGDCNTYATVYKVFDRPITSAGNYHDCLSYQCNSRGVMPTFSTKECYTFSRSYCRDGRRADGPVSQLFFQYRDICEKNHSTYPLLHSENPVELCNVSESLTPDTDAWVGVYRQRLFIDNSDKTVIQDFNQIEQYILRCDYLPVNDEVLQAENCSGKHHYVCVADTSKDIQEEPIKNTTSTPVCRSEDPYTGNADNQSSVNLRQYDLEFVKHSVVENIGIDPLKLPGMIIGIVISISVLVLTILVILAFMYRRTYAKENASSNTAGREDLNKNDMDNNTVISDYQQLDDVDDVQKNTNAYDQLSVTRNVHTESINDQANTSFSREEYSKYESIVDSNGINTNTAISDYEELHKSDKDTSTQAYDQLNVTRKVKTEPTNFFSKITASTEKHSKTESTKATAATSEYEQLDNAKKDKGVNVYDQLHVTDMIDNEQTNYKSKTTKPRDQQSNDKPTEETTKLSKRTVSSEYEHLDNATKDTSVNVCDNLNDSGVMDNDPTHHNPCQ